MAYAPRVYKTDGGDKLVVASGGTLLIEAGATVDFAGTQTFDEIGASDAALTVTGLAAAQGGTVDLVGGTSSTSGNAGGAVTATGGTPDATGAGGAVALAGAAGGATSGKGGAVTLTGGAGTAGNGAGGSIVVTAGAKHGSGLDGGIFHRATTLFRKQAAPGAGADQAEVLTAAMMINGIFVHTVTTGRTLTTPTGAAISAGCPSDLAVGDSFDFTVITLGTGADDIATLTAGDGNVTFVGKVTVGPETAAIANYGTWRFRNTATSTWVGYRIG